jgi:hypothetical protein
VSDTRRAPLTKALTGHSYDTMSQDSGMQCTCGSDSRFTQHDGSDLPWATFEEHLANVALAALDALSAQVLRDTHMTGWAPGNLQHHLIFDHDVSPSEVPYNGPLNKIHAREHAEQPEQPEEPEEQEHPDLVRLRAQEAEAIAQGYTEGDVNHNLQPLIGRLRLRERDRQDLAYDDLAYYIDRMHKACNAERALLAQHRQLTALATHLAAGLVDEDCELLGFSGSGRCIEPAVALRWENGFLDQVCEEHALRAQRAQDRQVLIIRPTSEQPGVRGG